MPQIAVALRHTIQNGIAGTHRFPLITHPQIALASSKPIATGSHRIYWHNIRKL
ncbi:MAG: hypothetical protein R3C61_04140 [Bacteroidia bacterium]